MCARRADERALRPWASYHPLHWTVSNRAPLPASRSQLPQLWANPQVSLLALALWGQRGGTALCSPGLERDSVPPAAGGGRTPTRGTGISDKHELATLGHIYVARGWLRLHSGEPLEHNIATHDRPPAKTHQRARGPAAFLGGHLCPFYSFRGLQGLAGWFGGGVTAGTRGVTGGTRGQSAKEADVDTLGECIYSKR